MIVNQQKQLGIRFAEEAWIYEGMIKNQIAHLESLTEFFSEEDITYGVSVANELLKVDYGIKNTNYLLKKTALEMAKEISLDKFQLSFLQSVQEHKCTFLIDEYLSFRYYRDGKNIHVLTMYVEEKDDGEHYLTSLIWRMDIDKELIYFSRVGQKGDIAFDVNEVPVDVIGEWGATTLKFFIQLLVFIELSDITIELVEAGRTSSGTKKTGKTLNASKSAVVLVDSKWNTISVRSEGFKVRGHWRMQPCGVGRKERKIIWVDAFQKHGYVRGRDKLNKSA